MHKGAGRIVVWLLVGSCCRNPVRTVNPRMKARHERRFCTGRIMWGDGVCLCKCWCREYEHSQYRQYTDARHSQQRSLVHDRVRRPTCCSGLFVGRVGGSCITFACACRTRKAWPLDRSCKYAVGRQSRERGMSVFTSNEILTRRIFIATPPLRKPLTRRPISSAPYPTSVLPPGEQRA